MHPVADGVSVAPDTDDPLLLLLLLQVHSAVLAGSGKEVVIKVLRPGTEDVLLTDLNFVSTVVACLLTHAQHAAAAATAAAADGFHQGAVARH
jgi:hypothetical protein